MKGTSLRLLKRLQRFGEEVVAGEIGVQRLAELVGQALMVDVYYRADFLLDSNDGELYCLEANTLPGMTPTSLVPQMAAEQGIDFGGICEKIIAVSMEKYK